MIGGVVRILQILHSKMLLIGQNGGAQKRLEKYDSKDVYVIGGESIYRQLLDECDVAHITKIDYSYDADAFFPNMDEKPEWKITKESDEQTYFDLEYYFLKYEKCQ